MSVLGPALCPIPCETCDKKGLPLLLVRRAVVAGELPMPAVPGNFKGSTSAGIPLGTHANYTQRLLRSGYVYVYDERYANQWDEYFVTEDGYLTKLPRRMACSPIPPKPPTTSFACARSGARPMASVITIPNAKHAKTVWIGFSDVQWTDEVMQQHNAAGHRAKHMTKISVSGGKVSPQKNTMPLEQVRDLVPEYAGQMNSELYRELLAASPFQFNHREQEWQNLMDAYKALRPDGGGAVVMVRDPAAIATELAMLMTMRFEVFKNDAKRKRPLALSAAIASLEGQVRAQAGVKEEQAAEMLANEMLGQPDLGMLFADYRQKKLQQIEDIRTVTPAEAKRAADNEWDKYLAKFDGNKLTTFNQQYEQELKQFDQEHIVPLAKAHAGWMKSGALATHYQLNYDPASPDSGIVYAKSVTLCIAGTQDKAVCFEVYDQWLNGDVTDKTNLLLRAMALNLDKTADEIKNAIKPNLDWRGFPFDNLMGGIVGIYKPVLEERIGAVGPLLTQIMGPMGKMLGQAVDGKVRGAMVLLGLHTEKTFAVVEVVGNKKAFRAQLIRRLLESSGQDIDRNKMQRAVAAELRRLELEGVNLKDPQTKKFLLMVDEESIRNMPKNLTAQQKANWLSGNIKTPAQLDEINFNHWKASMRNPMLKAAEGVGVPFIKAVVVGLIQYNMLNKLADDEGKAMNHERTETEWRHAAGIMALAGTMGELAGEGLEKMVVMVPKFGRGLSFWGALIKRWGGRVGIGGAVIMGGWDLKHAKESYDKEQYGMALLYVGSAALGVGAAIAFVMLLPGLGLALVAVIFVIALAIEYFKDNKVQEWLERCLWGKQASYASVEEELAQLKLALAG